LSPRPAPGGIRVYYDEFYSPTGETGPDEREARRARRHLRRLRRCVERPGRLLEAGSGDGYFIKAARDSGWQAEGLELAQPRIANAKKWFNVELQCADLNEAAFTPESFDAAALFQVLEHLHDPCGTLRRVHVLLRPGGILQLSTPNILAYARKQRGVNSWRILRHLFFFTPRSLARTVESLGFELIGRRLKFQVALEERLGWQPWPGKASFSSATRDLWTSFGLNLLARKR
jgi:SAM-dependent methyltransferase